MNDLQAQPRLFVCRETLAAGSSCESVVRRLASELAPQDVVLAEAVACSALAREAEESTYIGRGLAVPHARLAGLDTPRVCLAAAEAVDWHGSPASLVALLAVPEEQPEWHLRLLSILARYVSAHHNELSLSELAAALQQKTA